MNKADRIRKNAVKAGTRYAKKHSEGVTKDELLGLKVQTMSGWLRLFLGLAGITLILFAFTSWPSDELVTRAIEMVGGILLTIFGIFGIRRTLTNLADHGAGDLLELTIEGIGSIFGGIIDL